MSTTYTVDDFDRQHERLQQGKTSTREERQRVAALSRKHVQARLKAILDTTVTIRVTSLDGKTVESVTLPALEAMTTKLVEMALGQGEFASVKDSVRIQAYKAVHDRVYGAPKQTIEHTSSDVVEDETQELDVSQLERLESALESVLGPSVAVAKTLG